MLEILAPCGGADSVCAALKYGADAVYLGVKKFSARQSRNFTFEELKEAIKKCHSFNVKVYLALNTLIFDNELEQVAEILKEVTPDGFIIQDLGVLRLIKDRYPDLPVHASTQMSVTSVSGVKMAASLGFKRVVLARELSFKEISAITAVSPIETEVFVHGALCVSLSGQCYMSAFFGGRSGNRGACAQPCRLPMKAGNLSHALSLKDMSLISNIKELENIGVSAIKIEGRMKRPEYVAAAVNSCYIAREGGKADTKLLRAAFSRGADFTDGYYRDDYTNMSGIRSKKDKSAFNSFDINRLKQIREVEV
ncbi:MAG: U32 family peptidase [Oscillospiraceae bacterium]|nr:U32 family peptidase [Oscillospiraceae bacterium]